LKVLQEVITLIVFMIFTVVFFKNETFRLNHLIGFALLVLAVYFIFKKNSHAVLLVPYGKALIY